MEAVYKSTTSVLNAVPQFLASLAPGEEIPQRTEPFDASNPLHVIRMVRNMRRLTESVKERWPTLPSELREEARQTAAFLSTPIEGGLQTWAFGEHALALATYPRRYIFLVFNSVASKLISRMARTIANLGIEEDRKARQAWDRVVQRSPNFAHRIKIAMREPYGPEQWVESEKSDWQ